MAKITDSQQIASVMDRVEIANDPAFSGHVVTVYFKGVDRPAAASWAVGKNLKLAQRLKSALESGRAFDYIEKLTDVYGATYMGSAPKFMGRYLNSDLKKLGF